MSVPQVTANAGASVYVVGYQSPFPIGYPVYGYGRRQSGIYTGHAKVTPVFGSIAIASITQWVAADIWYQVWAAALSDVLVWGVGDVGGFSFGNDGVEYKLGTGAAASEIARASCLIPYAAPITLPAGQGWLWRPLLVKRGERLAVAGKCVTSLVNHEVNVYYEEI